MIKNKKENKNTTTILQDGACLPLMIDGNPGLMKP
jgi:hypothetical protein